MIKVTLMKITVEEYENIENKHIQGIPTYFCVYPDGVIKTFPVPENDKFFIQYEVGYG